MTPDERGHETEEGRKVKKGPIEGGTNSVLDIRSFKRGGKEAEERDVGLGKGGIPALRNLC